MTKGEALALLSDILDFYADTKEYQDSEVKRIDEMERYIKNNLK